MSQIFVLGGGPIGYTIALDLAGEYDVTIIDNDPDYSKENESNLSFIEADATDSNKLKNIIKDNQ